MTAVRKMKISVSLDADLVQAVDRRAARDRTTRSAIMEAWLRGAARQAALVRLQEDTAAYYDALAPAERNDDDALATSSARLARRLVVDESPSPRSRKR